VNTGDAMSSSYDELKRRLDAWDDIEKIKRLKYRYLECIDRGDFDGHRELCLANVEVDLKGGAYHLLFDNVEDFIASNKKAFSSEVLSSHTGHHPQIDLLGPGSARSRWYLLDTFVNITDRQVFNGSAVYEDLCEKVAGEWKFKRISYRRVFETVEPLREIPNVTASVVRRHELP